MSWKDIKRLNEQRGDILKEMRSLLKAAEDEGRDLTEAENGKFDDLNQRAEQIKASIQRYEQIAAIEGEVRNNQPGREDFDGRDSEHRTSREQLEKRRNEAFDAYLRGGIGALNEEQRSLLVTGHLPGDGLEARALTTAGIGVVGTREFSNELIKALRDFTGVLEAGARVITTSTGNPMGLLAVDDTSNEGSNEQDQGAAADDDVDPTFASQELGAYTYDSGVIRVPIELLQDSEVDLAAEIRSLASERIGVKLNKRTTLGSGTGQPLGFVTGATVGKTTASSSAITYDELLDLLHSVAAPYRRRGGRWQFNDQTLAAIRKLKDNDGRYIFAAGGAGAPNQVLGYDYVVNPAMDDIEAGKKPIAFGDFSTYRVRFVANPFIRRLEEAYAINRQVGFYVAQRADGRLTDAKAVKVLQLASGGES